MMLEKVRMGLRCDFEKGKDIAEKADTARKQVRATIAADYG